MAISNALLIQLAQECHAMQLPENRVTGIQGLIQQTHTVISQAADARLSLDDHPASYVQWITESASRS